MTWSRFDDRTRRHPKIARAGNEAAGFWMWAILYSNEYGLDGFIADDVLHTVPPVPIAPKKARELAERGVAAIVKPGGCGLFEKVAGGYRVHDIEDFQPTAEEALQQRTKRALAGRAGGVRSGESRRRGREAGASSADEANGEAGASRGGEANDEALASKQNAFASNPVPSRPVQNDPPTPFGVRETARRAFGEGIRAILRGPPFTLLDDEADVLMQVIADDPRWCALRGDLLAQAVRKSAADYARDRGSDAKFERGLSPTKWAEWRRSNPEAEARRGDQSIRKSNAFQEALMEKHGGSR